MKKINMIIGLMAAALSVNAQTELALFDSGALGLNGSTTTELAPGTELAKSDNVTCILEIKDGLKKVASFTTDGVDNIVEIDDAVIPLTDGIQGNTNPTKISKMQGATLKGGFQLKFQIGELEGADKWGQLYVAAKVTNNKPMYVFEEDANGAMRFVPFWVIYHVSGDENCHFITPYDMGVDEKTWNVTDENFDAKVANKNPKDLADASKVNHPDVTTAGNGPGVIWFDVVAGRNYYVFYTGSKIVASGYAFKQGGQAQSIKFKSADSTVKEFLKNGLLNPSGN